MSPVEERLERMALVGGNLYGCPLCGWTNYIGFAGLPTARLLARQHAAECPEKEADRD